MIKKKLELRRSLSYKNKNKQGEKKTNKITTESINKLDTAGNRKGKPEKLYARLQRGHQT